MWSTAMRVRSDPSVLEQLAVLRQSIAAACGEAAPNFGPMTIVDNLTSVRVDRAVHRSWWFARWPRREVPAGWMDRLIFETGCTRTISVVFEPVAPSRSDHAVDRELVQREANIESRHRRQFRITGKDRKALDEAQTREAELNAGYPELFYVGLVTLTAGDDDDLGAPSRPARTGRRPSRGRARTAVGTAGGRMGRLPAVGSHPRPPARGDMTMSTHPARRPRSTCTSPARPPRRSPALPRRGVRRPPRVHDER